MRDKSRILTVVNTSKRSTEAPKTYVATTSGGGSSSSGGGNKIIESKLMSAIAENYADAITQLMSASYLYNPAFANDAEGWTISEEDAQKEMAYITSSDNKNRLILSDTGSILQANDLIKKPGTHEEYTYTEETEEEGNGEGTTEETFTPSEELVTDQVTWTEIEEPQRKEGSEEKPDMLYLTLSCICRKSGTISVGFVGADESSEDALKTQTATMEKSDEIQTIEAEGTWDGTGDFKIYLTDGEFEIVSLSLLDKPLEEYRKQTDSHLKQIMENIVKAYEFIHAVISRIILIQGHINQLYSNDAIFKETTEDLTKRMEETEKAIKDLQDADVLLYELIDGINTTLTAHDERITAAQEKANTAYSWALDNWYEIFYNIKPAIEANATAITNLSERTTTLETSVSALSTSLTDLEERVKALEGE